MESATGRNQNPPVGDVNSSLLEANSIVAIDPSSDHTSKRNGAINFFVMNWHQILMRTGWIFKTESLIMPAVLDLIDGSAWLRGCLPMLNRFGQSVPPLLAANSIRNAPYKKRRLIISSTSMGIMFCLLAGLWLLKEQIPGPWLIGSILVLYAIFFSSLGVNQIILSALIGKLIPVLRRGKLMQFSSVFGSCVAVTCAWFLLNLWLTPENGNFAAIFLFAGVLFIAAGVMAIFFQEEPDQPETQRLTLGRQLREGLGVLRTDRNFRLLSVTSMLFGMMMTLFPHYQAVARERLNLGFDSLVPWIIAQNLGVAIFSLPVGWIADRRGNRLALKLLMGGIMFIPIVALCLANGGELGGKIYFIVFAMVGLTPVAIRTFNNYTLELVERDSHPKYLSLLSLFMAGPAVLGSLVIGYLIDRTGFELAFGIVALGQVIGFILCFFLTEPRTPSVRCRKI